MSNAKQWSCEVYWTFSYFNASSLFCWKIIRIQQNRMQKREIKFQIKFLRRKLNLKKLPYQRKRKILFKLTAYGSTFCSYFVVLIRFQWALSGVAHDTTELSTLVSSLSTQRKEASSTTHKSHEKTQKPTSLQPEEEVRSFSRVSHVFGDRWGNNSPLLFLFGCLICFSYHS